MAGIVRKVGVWPHTGWHDEPWQGPPDVDAFVKSAVGVAEVYSRGLPALELPAWRTWVQFGCGAASEDGRVHVSPRVDRMDTETEVVGVALPRGVAGWAPEDRARLVLEVLHAGMVRLGQDRGWDPARLGALYADTLAGGLEHSGTGAWKVSPDRRHQARTSWRTGADGQGRLRLEVADRTGEVLAVTEEVFGWRDEKTRPLRWHGSDRVGLVTIPGVARLREASLFLERVEERWQSVAADTNSGRLPVAGAGAAAGRALPEVVATGYGLAAPEDEHPPRIRAGGGGPTNGVSSAYLDAADRRLRDFADAGQAWWQDAGVRELEVTYHFGPDPGIWSRRAGERLRAEIRRPAASTHRDPEELAAADVRALVAEVRRKTGLGPHPTVRG